MMPKELNNTQQKKPQIIFEAFFIFNNYAVGYAPLYYLY